MGGDWQASALAPLTVTERSHLLWLARQAIGAALRAMPPPRLTMSTHALLQPGGAFVSLHAAGRLRGCVGTLTADRPLHEAVCRMSLGAAFEDPRFSAVSLADLPQIRIEISRLSAPVASKQEEFVLGRDGVCVVHGQHRGVLLPQVAGLHGWDRTQLLDEACRKANLPARAWQEPTCRLLRFQAEVFGDEAA
jgi:AmmeMemoRadiSam system protein A